MENVTQILDAIEQGNPQAANDLLPIVYEELRRLASHRMSNEAPGQTLQGTALVHEAYIRLVGDNGQNWQNRGHFFAAAAEAMRRIMIEKARKKKSVRSGGGVKPLDISKVEIADAVENDPAELLSLDEALTELDQQDPIAARVVNLRFFGGLSEIEAADALGISRYTAQSSWAYARAWLHRKVIEH